MPRHHFLSIFLGLDTFYYRSSENLNTEVGVVIHDASVAHKVEQAIETDMQPGNSWNAAKGRPDQYGPLIKRSRIRL